MNTNVTEAKGEASDSFGEFRRSGLALCISIAAVEASEAWWFYGFRNEATDGLGCPLDIARLPQFILWILAVASAIGIFALSFYIQYRAYVAAGHKASKDLANYSHTAMNRVYEDFIEPLPQLDKDMLLKRQSIILMKQLSDQVGGLELVKPGIDASHTNFTKLEEQSRTQLGEYYDIAKSLLEATAFFVAQIQRRGADEGRIRETNDKITLWLVRIAGLNLCVAILYIVLFNPPQ